MTSYHLKFCQSTRTSKQCAHKALASDIQTLLNAFPGNGNLVMSLNKLDRAFRSISRDSVNVNFWKTTTVKYHSDTLLNSLSNPHLSFARHKALLSFFGTLLNLLSNPNLSFARRKAFLSLEFRVFSRYLCPPGLRTGLDFSPAVLGNDYLRVVWSNFFEYLFHSTENIVVKTQLYADSSGTTKIIGFKIDLRLLFKHEDHEIDIYAGEIASYDEDSKVIDDEGKLNIESKDILDNLISIHCQYVLLSSINRL